MARSAPADQDLLTTLDSALQAAAPRRVLVAWSGGPDSTALLHACRQLIGGDALVAVHVNHRLQRAADDMAAWCARESDTLGVACHVVTVEGAPAPGDSVEAWARDQRYAALAEAAGPGDVVLTAHHADDQAESVLLALLRGSGLPGLSGLAASRPLGPAQLLRPWKSMSRSTIADYAARHGLPSLHDPSNDDARYTRNWLRQAVVPTLVERCPAAVESLGRSAVHAAEAQVLLDELATEDMACLQPDACSINLDALRQLSAARQRNVLRHWMAQRNLPLPGTDRLDALMINVVQAAQDAQPVLKLGAVEARRHRDRLYLGPPLPMPPPDWQARWQGAACHLPTGLGVLTTPSAGQWTVRLAQAGDAVVQAGRPRKAFTRWCQEQSVPVWLRSRTPLVFAGDTLCAVGGLTLAAESAPGNLHWQTSLPGAQCLVP